MNAMDLPPGTKHATDIPSWLSVATSKPVVRRAFGYLFVVGGILVAINHGDALLRGEMEPSRALKILLTPLVPYCVSTLSSVAAIRDQAKAASAKAESS